MSYNLLCPIPVTAQPRVLAQTTLPSAKIKTYLVSPFQMCPVGLPWQSLKVSSLPSSSPSPRPTLGGTSFTQPMPGSPTPFLTLFLQRLQQSRTTSLFCEEQRLQGCVGYWGRWYSAIRYRHEPNSLNQTAHFGHLIKESVSSWGCRLQRATFILSGWVCDVSVLPILL